jgi:hypothetical protein
VERLGAADAVVVLNVGGKEFVTSRSTVSRSPILHRHLLAAEEHGALARNGAIFVDRDPATFEHVLTHLRNVAGGVHRPGAAQWMGVEYTVELDALEWYASRTLYTEAVYYQLPSLVEQLRKHKYRYGFAQRFGGSVLSSGRTSFTYLKQVSLLAAALGVTWHVGSQDVVTLPEDGENTGSWAQVLAKVGAAMSGFS